MRRGRRSATILLATLALACLAPARGSAQVGVDVPYLRGRVVDDAEVVEAIARGRIADRLKAHEQATGNQVVVLTVPTIGSVSIEDFAVKVFEAWKLGQKGKDNGVLIVVAVQDRKMRIEVGYGLEGTLTDGQCGQIIRTVMTPRFKEGDYTRGVEDGASAVVARLEGAEIPAAPPSAPGAGSSSSTSGFGQVALGWPERILFGAFMFGILGLFTVIGVMTPGVGWFLYVFLIPFWAMFPIIVLGGPATVGLLATYLVGYPVAKLYLRRTSWYARASQDLKTKGRAQIGGFTVGSSGDSGWSSSSSSSSSSFSGGGGSSGGGGASGSW
jgi:uncharacterized protein